MARKAAPVHPLLARGKTQFRKIAAADYHADRSALGRSHLWTFRNRRRQFESEFLEGMAPQNGKSKEMDLGTLAHAALLEPENLADRYVCFPADVLDKRGGETTTAAEKFRADHEAAGRVVLKSKDLEPIRSMVSSVHNTLGSRGWLELPAQREQAVYWNDPETGIRCRALVDWLILTSSTAFVIDFKTTGDASPSGFRYACEDFGYWLQDAFYSHGVRLATGLAVEFLFVVVERKFPFCCTVQRLSAADRSRAEESRGALLGSLADCLRSGNFQEPWESQVSEISLRPTCYQVTA